MDRWCTHCNTYQSTMSCRHCHRLTSPTLVMPNHDTPKLRCAGCQAPFEGLRFHNVSGLPLGMKYKAHVERNELQVEVSVTQEGPWVGRFASPGPFEVLNCPHCQRPLLRARAVNTTSHSVTTTLALAVRQDEGLVLAVETKLGELTQ